MTFKTRKMKLMTFRIKKDSTEDERTEKVTIDVRKSQKIQKQRMGIEPDQIGDCDNLQELDCK